MPIKDTLRCPSCSTVFQKLRKEITRQNKQGNFTFYCTRHCAAVGANKKRDPVKQQAAGHRLAQWCKDNPSKRGQNTANSFKIILRRIRQRVVSLRHWELNLDVEYLNHLWSSQQGKCALSGVNMSLPTYKSGAGKLTQASLDRVDSSKGYVPGNVQFVCMGLNFAKSNKSQQEALDFVEAIREAGPQHRAD